MDPLLQVKIIFSNALAAGNIDKSSPLDIIAKGMDIMNRFEILKGAEKKQVLIQMIQTLAAEKSDLLPPKTVEGIRALLENNLIDDTINVLSSVAKGNFDISKAKEVAVGCFNVFKTCTKK